MCTCCQNWTNIIGGVNTQTTCNNGLQRTGCGGRAGCGGRLGGGVVNNGGCGGFVNNGCYYGCGRRYIQFPISGTAVVPVSAIQFYPTAWGNVNGCATTQTDTTANGCGFGGCGGATAIANYYQDYYARQYGLND